MSVLNCVDDPVECPLCMEPLEMDDINFFPCTCGYQICRFCWHRIRTDENGLCPACRKAYPENPAEYKPLTQEELQNIKQEKRQKDLQRKQKVTENRKHLANVRVVQKNLVFVVGLSTRLADIETLKKSEYFGKFGKILKVVINHSTAYAGSQGPSASAYVTYQKPEDALRAIQVVNNIHVDGRVLKVSLGTTKYCSHFMKNQACPKNDCMYLHELGDESASFTKEEMQQGKHQELEKRLQEQYLGVNTGNSNGLSPSGSSANITTTSDGIPIAPLIPVPLIPGFVGGSGNSSGSHNSKKNTSNAINSSTGSSNSNYNNSISGTISIIKENISAPKKNLSSEVNDGWPALNTVTNTKDSSNTTSKRTRSKSERNSGSARQTPTEEHNKRNNREREKKVSQSNHSAKENGVASKDGSCDDDNSPSSSQQASLSTTPSSTQDSCVSSASATPPPTSATPPHTSALATPPPRTSNTQDSLSVPPTPPLLSDASPPPHSELSPPLHPASSPMPVNDTSEYRSERDSTSSPIGTTPSSLSSCSELSSSVPMSFQPLSHTSSEPDPPSIPSSSLFTDNSHNTNTFFSQEAFQDLHHRTDGEKVTSSFESSVEGAGQNLVQQQKTRDDSDAEFLLSSTLPKEELQNSFRPSFTNGEFNHISSDWRTASLSIPNDHMYMAGADNCSNNTWNAMFEYDNDSDIKSSPVIGQTVDDELGFDPFEETKKALAEDIILERKEKQRNLQLRQQQLFLQKQQQLQQQQLEQQQQQQQQMQLQSGLKNFLDGYSSPSIKDITQTRLPPPGFNGMSSGMSSGVSTGMSGLGGFHSSMQQTQPTHSKIMPQFAGGLSANSLSGLGSNNSSAMQINGLIGSNRLGVPPGLSSGNLGGNLLSGLPSSGLHSGLVGGVNSGLANHHMPSTMLNLDGSMVNQAPPGLGLAKPGDPFVFKDMDNGLNSVRNIFPASISSGNSMNTGTTLNTVNNMNSVNNTLNSLAANTPQGTLASQNNPLSTFLTMAQQQTHLQQQQHHFPSQQNLMHHFGSSMLSNSQKAWGSGGVTDLTALDPAIVSSGQLTDSRSDSPPHWLKSVEQTPMQNDPAGLGGATWGNLLQYNLISGSVAGLSGPVAGMHNHLASQNIQQHPARRSAIWPPNSPPPPPGFNSISPLLHGKQREAHKIENL